MSKTRQELQDERMQRHAELERSSQLEASEQRERDAAYDRVRLVTERRDAQEEAVQARQRERKLREALSRSQGLLQESSELFDEDGSQVMASALHQQHEANARVLAEATNERKPWQIRERKLEEALRDLAHLARGWLSESTIDNFMAALAEEDPRT